MRKRSLLQWLAAGSSGLFAYSIFQRLREKRYSFQDKVVVITGGSRGLGLVLARQLAMQGAHLALCARDQAELDMAFEELDRLHARVRVYSCDVGDSEQVKQTVRAIVTHYGHIDVLINNAGRMVVAPFNSNSRNDFRELMDVHFWGAYNFIKACLAVFRKQGTGRIVNISSIGGLISVPHLVPYSASKFALTGLSEGLAASLRREHIYVTTVTPGLMRTGSPRNVDIKGLYEREYRWFKVSDSLPFFTTDAEDAARQIIRACKRGTPALTIGLPYKLARIAHSIAPGFTVRMLSGVNRWILPPPVKRKHSRKGYETRFEKQRSPLTRLTDKAARENNEIKP
jgi:short-subunit dehydrogenase